MRTTGCTILFQTVFRKIDQAMLECLNLYRFEELSLKKFLSLARSQEIKNNFIWKFLKITLAVNMSKVKAIFLIITNSVWSCIFQNRYIFKMYAENVTKKEDSQSWLNANYRLLTVHFPQRSSFWTKNDRFLQKYRNSYKRLFYCILYVENAIARNNYRAQ